MDCNAGDHPFDMLENVTSTLTKRLVGGGLQDSSEMMGVTQNQKRFSRCLLQVHYAHMRGYKWCKSYSREVGDRSLLTSASKRTIIRAGR